MQNVFCWFRLITLILLIVAEAEWRQRQIRVSSDEFSERYHLTGTALHRITNMARQLVTGQQCGKRCAPKWDKIQLDSKSLAVAPGLSALVAVAPLSCIKDEAPYWQRAEDVFEVMNSGTQTHNISGHILTRLVYSQGLLCWIKQIHLLGPEVKTSCLLSVRCFCSKANSVCAFFRT